LFRKPVPTFRNHALARGDASVVRARKARGRSPAGAASFAFDGQAFWWSMIFFRKPVPTPDQVRGRLFRDHALSVGRSRGRKIAELSSPPYMKIVAVQYRNTSATIAEGRRAWVLT